MLAVGSPAPRSSETIPVGRASPRARELRSRLGEPLSLLLFPVFIPVGRGRPVATGRLAKREERAPVGSPLAPPPRISETRPKKKKEAASDKLFNEQDRGRGTLELTLDKTGGESESVGGDSTDNRVEELSDASGGEREDGSEVCGDAGDDSGGESKVQKASGESGSGKAGSGKAGGGRSSSLDGERNVRGQTRDESGQSSSGGSNVSSNEDRDEA